MHAGEGARLEVGVGHVVAVAHIGHRKAALAPLVLADREQVGQDLARVERVGQGVDDRDVGPAGDLLDLGLRKGAQHDAVVEVLQDLDGVLHRLAARERRVVVGHHAGVGPQAVGADLEGVARAQGRLLHDDGDRLPGKGRVMLPGGPCRLLAGGSLKDERYLRRREVHKTQQVATGKSVFQRSPFSEDGQRGRIAAKEGRPAHPGGRTHVRHACLQCSHHTAKSHGGKHIEGLFMQYRYINRSIYSFFRKPSGWHGKVGGHPDAPQSGAPRHNLTYQALYRSGTGKRPR